MKGGSCRAHPRELRARDRERVGFVGIVYRTARTHFKNRQPSYFGRTNERKRPRRRQGIVDHGPRLCVLGQLSGNSATVEWLVRIVKLRGLRQLSYEL